MRKKITAVVLCLVMALGAAVPSFAAPILAEKRVTNTQNDKAPEANKQEGDKKQAQTPQVKEPMTESTTERQLGKTAPKSDEQQMGKAEMPEDLSREPLSEMTTEALEEATRPQPEDFDKDETRPEPPTLEEGMTMPEAPELPDDDREMTFPEDWELEKPDFDFEGEAPRLEPDFDNGYVNGAKNEAVKDNDAPPFEDVEKDSWYYKYVDKAYKKGYISGKSEKSFAPQDTVTGAELLVMLYRAEGHTLGPVLAEKRWYQNAVDWAWENSILTADLKDFNPDAPITREEVMYILCRYLAFKGMDIKTDNDLKAFSDRDKVSDYAKSSAGMLADEGIVTGTDGKLNPQDSLTRAEGAVMLVKIFEDVLGEE